MTTYSLVSGREQVRKKLSFHMLQSAFEKGFLYHPIKRIMLLTLMICSWFVIQKDLAPDVLYRLLPFLLMGIGQLMVSGSFSEKRSLIKALEK